MPQTMVEKILQAHTEEEVAPGKIVWIDIDVRSARDFGGASVVKHFQHHYPGARVHDPSKTFFTFDCNAPANTIAYATNQQLCRRFAREHGIRVYDCNAGIGSHVMIEEGIARPGSTVVGTDSHLNILGAVGAFGQGMGDQDIAFVFKAGKTWFEVPETMRVPIHGSLPSVCSAKDLTLKVCGTLGTKGALGMAVEFYGEAIEALDLPGRITLASMATEMGAITAFMPSVEGISADPDARYAKEGSIDISELKPQIAKPPRPDAVVDVETLRHVRVDSVFIGSCTNGTYEDISRVAGLVKGRKVRDGVLASVVPATMKGYKRLLKEGWIEALVDAGFLVSNPGCGGCASGQIGMTGKDEVQVSTSNRNFAGKQGDGYTYLASPETAAASALLGRIATMEEVV
ncbi:MAG: aconitase/3-isopropylmalate dehydratase large subunit family protein [Candidatus Thermoplasmatota archaeon]